MFRSKEILEQLIKINQNLETLINKYETLSEESMRNTQEITKVFDLLTRDNEAEFRQLIDEEREKRRMDEAAR